MSTRTDGNKVQSLDYNFDLYGIYSRFRSVYRRWRAFYHNARSKWNLANSPYLWVEFLHALLKRGRKKSERRLSTLPSSLLFCIVVDVLVTSLSLSCPRRWCFKSYLFEMCAWIGSRSWYSHPDSRADSAGSDEKKLRTHQENFFQIEPYLYHHDNLFDRHHDSWTYH